MAPEKLEALRALAPRLEDACAEIASLGIRDALEHGDAWPGNIWAREDGSFLVYDWSDASLAHPFTSVIERDLRERLEFGEDDVRRLVDAYLAPWLDLAPEGEVRRAYQLAQVLAQLHRAVSYYRLIMPMAEDRAMWGPAGAYHLSQVLEGASLLDG